MSLQCPPPNVASSIYFERPVLLSSTTIICPATLTYTSELNQVILSRNLQVTYSGIDTVDQCTHSLYTNQPDSTVMIVPLRDKIKNGETAFGVWSTIPSEAMARMVAGTPGVTWFVIDAEHGQYNDTHLYSHAAAVAGLNPPRSPIIRIPIDSDWWIKRALDAGAHGILVPLVRTTEQAKAIVQNAKYPPRGMRGFGPMYTHHSFDCNGAEYKAGADDNLVVIIQIENDEALGNVEEIAQIDGVDVLFVGPYDLSLSLGVNFGGEDHEAAIAKVLATAHKHGKKAAMYCNNGEQARARALQGFDLVTVVTDIDVISTGFANAVKTAQGL